MSNDILKTALTYAGMGYKIVPVHCGRGNKNKLNKAPACPHGAKDGTTDTEQIRAWFADGKQKNIGITCQNLIVLDIDTKHGDGLAELAELENELGKLPIGPVVQTPSGGRHLYFQHPGVPIKGRPKIIKNGKELQIDIRIGDQMVVAPPSEYEGNAYTWLNPLIPLETLPHLPQAWIDWLPKKNPTAAPKSAQAAPISNSEILECDYLDCLSAPPWIDEIDTAERVRRCEKYIDRAEVFTEGDGGGKLLHVCNVIYWGFGFGRHDPKARAILDGYLSQVRHNDGSPYLWNEDDIQRKINEVYNKPPNYPFGCRRRAYQMNAALKLPLDFTVNGERVNEQADTKPAQTRGEESGKPKFIIQPMSDFKDQILKSFVSEVNIIETGFTKLDKFLCGGISGLFLLGGPPGLGKSSLALQIADHNAYIGKKVLIVSLEMSRNQLAAKGVSRISGGLVYGLPDGALFDYPTQGTAEKRADKIKNKSLNLKQIMRQHDTPLTAEQAELYQKAWRLYSDAVMPNLMVIQREKGDRRRVSTDDLERSLEYHERMTGDSPHLIITDYLQLFNEESRNGHELTDKQQADQAVGNLKVISDDIPVIAISSFNRPAYTKPVSRESFKESGGIEYTAEGMGGIQPAIPWEDIEEKDVPGYLNQWHRTGRE